MTFGPVKHMLKPHPNSVSRNQFSPGRGPELRLRVRTQNHKSLYRISQDGLKVKIPWSLSAKFCLFDVQEIIVLGPLACMSALKENSENFPVYKAKAILMHVSCK